MTRRDVRLASGLILFTYVASHMATHAAGLHSLGLAEKVLQVAVWFWHSLPGSVLLYGAAAVHVVLALHAIYQRRTLRMPPLDLLRIALGLAIPTLLIGHAAATRLAFEMYGHLPTYTRIVWNLWNSDNEGRQLALLAPGWLHGCLGVYYAFNRRGWFVRTRMVWFALALLLPVLSAIGFFNMGKELAVRAADLAWMAAHAAPIDAAHRVALGRLRDTLLALYFGAIAAVFIARALRNLVERQRGALITISYPNRQVSIPRGWSVLEASRSHHIPHQSMCGGRARCSTCRVRVTTGAAHCAAPQEDELRTLERIGAAADVRLACQLRPDASISVVPLLDPVAARATMPGSTTECEVVLLQARLTGWREAALQMLPQDRLYLLTTFSQACQAAIAHAGGPSNPQNGERVLGIFLQDGKPADAVTSALAAATAIQEQVHGLHARLAGTPAAAIGMQVCVHAGPAAVGSLGADASHAVATGPALDDLQRIIDEPGATASAWLVVSEPTLQLAGKAVPPDATVQAIPGEPPLRAVCMAGLALPEASGPG